MGYVFRLRLASFFAGASAASFAGLYFLYKDYKLAHESISHQIKRAHDSLDERISSLEKLKEIEAAQQLEVADLLVFKDKGMVIELLLFTRYIGYDDDCSSGLG